MRRALGAALAAALVGCDRPAPRGYTLLFLGRSPAASVGGRSWAPDPEHSRLVAFDGRLGFARELRNPRLNTPMAVAPLGSAELLVTERTGDAVVLDTLGRAVREWESPDVASVYASDATARRVVATRSPYYVPALAPPEPDAAPLIRILDTLGHPTEGRATLRRPDLGYLAHMVNAGAVATGPDGAVYFGPLVRDEIRKYGPGGALRWTARRGLYATESDPVFVPAQGTALRIRTALATVALALGPDGRLYALGADDSLAARLRLDVLDTATGAILATRHLAAHETAVAVDQAGAVALFDRDSLLARAGAAPSGREPFRPEFALPTLAGDTVTLARFAGTVTLVNFWASWCDPCREEFPLMAALYREFGRQDFAIVAISDDVDRAKMTAFVRALRPPFPILAGAGRMKTVYHYRGLPYSVLLDRTGHVIERIFGFGGAAAFAQLHETIANEVRVP